MRKIFIASIIALAGLVSCNKELPAGAPEKAAEAGEIVFVTDSFDASVSTKAVTPVTSLTSFYCLATTGTPGNSAESTANGFTSTSFTNSSSKYKGGKYWPTSDPSYHFYAATKALTLASGNVTFKPSATIADDVYAYLANPTYASENALTFNHIYAQVGKCTITAPSGYTVSGLTVKITPKVPTANATFNVRTGAWSTTASHYTDASEVTLCNATGSTTDNDLWLVPGSYTLTAQYTLTKGAYSETFTKTATVNLVMGKNNNISATLPAGNAAEIVFTVTITPWADNAINATFN